MNRSLKLSILLALALGSSQAAALELGQIQVKSALGQPLVAEIPVNPGSPAELQNLTARLASSEDAAQAGVAAGPSIPLQFAVVDGANGKKVIRITSAAPVNDPYLDLLVEVNNASGKSLREFTILLDPPGSAASNVPATRAPTQSAGKPSRHTTPPAASSTESTAAAPAPAPEAKPSKPAPAPRANASAGGSYTVERGQTLSAIAHETAPAGVDMNQMLLALKSSNPDAFYRDNINALKTGAVLRIPTKEDAAALTAAAALAEVRQQNSDWRSGAARTPTTVADTGTRANASSAPAAANPTGDHLALVPSKEGSDNAAGHGGKGDKAAAEKGMVALHQDLLRSQEALTSLTKQGDELKSRLKDLEDINGKNERLLSLKDSEIADLQHKLADARKTAGQPAAAATAAAAAAAAKATATKTPEAETVVKANAPAAAGSAPSTASAAPASSASAPAHASSAPVAAAKPAPAKPAAKPAAQPAAPVAEEDPWYMQTWAWGAGAGVILLGLLAALRGRSRKAAAPEAGAGASSLADRFGTVTPGGATDADHDQEELLDQLAEHPDDIGLHLELVSLYYSRRDVDHFEAAAEAMHAHITDPQQPEWVDVVHMGEDLVPEHPLFAHALPTMRAHAGDEHEALDQFDLGSYAKEHELDHDHDEDDIPPIPTSPAQHAPKVSGYHFDFDLTPRQAQAAGGTPVTGGHDEVREEEHDVQAHTPTWHFAEPEGEEALEDKALPQSHDLNTGFGHEAADHELDHDLGGQFSDDPVDTKLDLARAYLDMGDPDGAQAMLEEVIHEGTQMQKDVAKRLLETIR
ncbi:FimV/HubP family polar landmark protein [Dyella telluris]|uniref:Fimbrial protein FimV n=1 Tax=Dyella telluris TaxID=2763498 RepID=A0A7G8Q559_9GAMM|nr:FimV/HubP family polar landmark protein [Dyella telluris]QNK01917.1 fimbrial protein FimV [Dyella telluris]